MCADNTVSASSTDQRPSNHVIYKLTNTDEICGLLGGHPLSIVLIAKQLTDGKYVADLLTLLEKNRSKQISIPGLSTSSAKHDSLTSALLTSYQSLSDEARVLFVTLGLLPSGIQKNLLSNIQTTESTAIVDELLDSSLLEYNPSLNRYWQLPPIRLFAEDCVPEDKLAVFCEKLFVLMYSIGVELCDRSMTKEGYFHRYAISVEEPNFRSVFECILEKKYAPTPNDFFLFSSNLIQLYIIINRFEAIPNLTDKALSYLKGDSVKFERSILLVKSGFAMKVLGQTTTAQHTFNKAIDILRSIPKKEQDTDIYKFTLCRVLLEHGSLKMKHGKLDHAFEDFAKATEISTECEKLYLMAAAHRYTSEYHFRKGNIKDAITMSAESLELTNKDDNSNAQEQIYSLLWHGGMLTLAECPDEAESYLTQALDITEKISDSRSSWQVFEFRGHLRLIQGHIEEVIADADKAFEYFRSINDALGQSEMLMIGTIATAYIPDIPGAKELMVKTLEHIDRYPDWHSCVRWLIFHIKNVTQLSKPDTREFLVEMAESCANRTTDDSLKEDVRNLKEQDK